MDKKEFVSKITNACAAAHNAGARFCDAVVCAQAALESNWGNSTLARKANNLFGIKAGKNWEGLTIELPTWEWDKSRGWYKTVSIWARWNSWEACIIYYGYMLEKFSWFRGALKHLDDADEFLRALLPTNGKPGWATDPEYFSKVKQCGADIERLGGPRWS